MRGAQLSGIVVIGAVFVDIKGFPLDAYIPTGRNGIRSSLCEHPVMIIKVTPIIIVLSKVSVAFM